MTWSWVDLYAAAEATVQSLAAPAELNNVRLRLEGGSAMVYGIHPLLSSILFNLTDNAVKYNKPGGSVTLRVENREKEVVLTVSDTGIGIPEEHQDRIFERFYRVDKARSRAAGGTGLGLSIVSDTVKRRGGTVEAANRPGGGAVFTVRWPAVKGGGAV